MSAEPGISDPREPGAGRSLSGKGSRWPEPRCNGQIDSDFTGLYTLQAIPGLQQQSAGHRLLIPQCECYQKRARMLAASADGQSGPPGPQVDLREVRPHLCTRRAETWVRTHGDGKRGTLVGCVWQGPLALSPRGDESPSPSIPPCPQHLTVASSCNERGAGY